MTLREITDGASFIVGKEIDIGASQKIVFECVNIITALYESACPIISAAAECTDTNEIYALPNNRGVYRVVDGDGAKAADYSHCIRGIQFRRKGSYVVYLYKADFQAAGENDELEINSKYHPEAVKYLAYKILQAKDPASAILPQLLDEFFTNIKAIDAGLANFLKKRLPAKIPARDWR